MRVRDVVQMLEQDGWRQVVQRGSHRQFRHPTKPGRVTVAGKPGQELAPVRWAAFCDRLVCRRRPVEHLDRGVRTNCHRMERLPALATAQFTNFAADYSPISRVTTDQLRSPQTTKVALPECAQNRPEQPRRDHLRTPVPVTPVSDLCQIGRRLLFIHSITTR